jgi:hypothetical protein
MPRRDVLNDAPLSVGNLTGAPQRSTASATTLIAAREFSVKSTAQASAIREQSSSTWYTTCLERRSSSRRTSAPSSCHMSLALGQRNLR